MTFDWYPKEREHKSVILCDIDKYENVDDSQVAHALMGMGLCEWEYYMGKVFTQSIKEARELGKDTADITKMFSCDLVGVDRFGEYTKRQENVIKFLCEKLFDTVNDTDDEMMVSVKPGVFSN